MGATEEVAFRILVDGEIAKRSLEEIRKSAMGMGGAVADVTKHIDNLRAKQLALSIALSEGAKGLDVDRVKMNALRKELESTTAALNAFGTSQAKVTESVRHFSPFIDDGIVKQTNWRKSIGAAKEHIEKQAGAIGALTIAFGTQEGAIGKVIRGAGGLAAAYGSGGALGVALAGTVTAVQLLDDHYASVLQKQDAMIERAFAASDSVINERKAIEAQRDALRVDLGKKDTPAEVYAKYQTKIDDAEKRLQEARDKRDRAGWMNLTKTIELLKEVQGLASAKAAGDGGVDPKLEKWRKDLEAIKGETSEGVLGGAGTDEWLPFSKWSKPEDDARKALANRIDKDFFSKQLASLKPLGDGLTKVKLGYTEVDAEASKLRLHKALWDDVGLSIKSAAFSMKDEFGVAAKSTFSMSIGVAQDYFDAVITGQEHAAEAAAAAFLKGTGQQLVGLGTEAMFKGGMYLIDSAGIDPRGYALLGLGGAAIAAGVGMGAGGTALAHTAAGGTVGHALPEKPSSRSATDRGVNSGRSAGSGGGGQGANIYITYGAAGPAPEDTGREVERVLAVHRRRVGAR